MGKKNGSKYAKKKEEQRHGLRQPFGGSSQVNGSVPAQNASHDAGRAGPGSQGSSFPSQYDIFNGASRIVTLAYLGGENVPLRKPSLWSFRGDYIPAVEQIKTRASHLDAQEEVDGLWTIRRLSGFAGIETGRATIDASHVEVARLLTDWSAVAGAHPKNTASQQEHMKQLGPETAYVTRDNFSFGRQSRPSGRRLAY